jgi:hypothetical protein
LKNVVKFFIFLIVIVFDPLAVALIIAFNGLIDDKKKKQKEILTEIMENDEKLGLYDNLDDLMEENYKNYEVYGDNGKNSPKNEVIVENIPQNEPIETTSLPYYEEPNFDWENKNLWINNPSAVKYWMNSGNSINNFKKLYKQHLDELDNTNLTKTY